MALWAPRPFGHCLHAPYGESLVPAERQTNLQGTSVIWPPDVRWPAPGSLAGSSGLL